jgi:Fungal chitosanase of glycosyl hydrolase group 75
MQSRALLIPVVPLLLVLAAFAVVGAQAQAPFASAALAAATVTSSSLGPSKVTTSVAGVARSIATTTSPATTSTTTTRIAGTVASTAVAGVNGNAGSTCQAKKVLSVREQQWQGTGVSRLQNRFKLVGKNGFWFTSGMTIDADGSPRAFHPISDLGLDDLANAGKKGNWWGIMTNNGETYGKPIVQGPTDPAPGFYISQTGLEDTTKKERDPRRYVDAEKVPYVVLSGTSKQNFGAVFGDYMVVYNIENGKYAFGMYGDNWPTLKIGEGSIALAKELDINADPRNGGVEDPTVVYLVFPRSRTKAWTAEEAVAQMRTDADAKFQAWGGLTQLTACVAG